MLGSSAIFADRGSFVKNELDSSKYTKIKIRKIQILLAVVLSTFLLQEKNIFLPFKVYRYVCARHGTSTQLRLILKRPLIIEF